MSFPRQVLPGTTYLLTRRCSERRFFLTPSKIVNCILLFCLAIAAKRFEVELHAFCFLSNHYHLVATDLNGRLPEFMRWFNEFTAKALNVLRRRWEPLWAPEPYSAVALPTAEDVLGEIVYTLTNPVRHKLVEHGHQWPGLRVGPGHLGRTLAPRRPRVYFKRDGKLPWMETLRIVKPKAFDLMSDEDFVKLTNDRVQAREAEIRKKVRREGGQFLGAAAVMAQSPHARPRSRSPRRGLRPSLACKDRALRIARLRQHKTFRSEHEAARQDVLRGVRDVTFPAGTYWMRVHLGVKCAAAG